ncbi:MAG: DNA mismatch repair endonuclease MutL [Planctomycetes bacterium]|nr:DNA mismatch repair endonuclease MutL [Planctomycetota bacterium]
MSIRVLSPLLVNQIAAGEVIERPASVVKELIENAIDAGATRIDVVLERGGKELVRVTDDGGGIPADELELAVAPHATSKIDRAEDLDTIATMGFRGEALASIASVSRLALRSRQAETDRATIIEVEGETVSGPRPEPGPKGTTVTIRNLFFNTPARRKFLKTDQTESGRSTETVRTLALGHPSIGFTLTHDGRRRLELPPGQEPRARVLAVLGRELEGELIEVRSAPGGEVGIWGLAGTPDIARGTNRHQRVFLNGRAINDRTIAHAIKESYRGLIEPSRFPTVVLFMEMDPASVDVNVHPAKAEVRFRNQVAVHKSVIAAIRDALREADLTPTLDVSAPPRFDVPRATSHGRPTDAASAPAGFAYREMKSALAAEATEVLGREIAVADTPESLVDRVRPVTQALQVHASYIVTQDREGLVIIDQHALHERVMFEKLKQRVERGALESQRLLMPAVVEVDVREAEALESLGTLLERLGIETQRLGPAAIGIHAFTALLFERGVDPVVFVRDLLVKAAGEGLDANPEAALHEVLDMMACKAAVKAGDRLEPREIEELLAYRDTVERSSNCPHGRPTTLRLSLRELERQFGRR